jgi:radical SAM superfamily enzyme YgiQ (UPF0313 family)
MPNRLLIIQPSYYKSRKDRTVARARHRDLVPLPLPYLAALTPPDWDVRLVDELVAPVDFDAPVDVVAITTWTINSLRSYDLAAEFRRRGKIVMLGGPHTWFYGDEAAQHADAVAVGEGEVLWKQMLEDAAAGRLKNIYRSGRQSDLKGLPFPRYDLLDTRPYGPFKTFVVQSTRGCPFVCDFCSERLYLGTGFRCRPIPEVVDEIKRLPSRNIFFAESNFGGRPAYAMELMEAIAPLKVRWSTLWSLNLCSNRKFMDLAQRSGLLHVNIGMESLDQSTIESMRKRQNPTARYAEILRDFRRRGISYSLNFIFGWDTETKAVFDTTRDFLQREKVPVAYFNVLTPDRGTAYYDRMRKSNRILNEAEIGRFPGQVCHIRPSFCEPSELEREVQGLYREFYSLPSMLSRLPLPLTKAGIASWMLNISQRRMARTMSDNINFADY